jgi:hypothetical protein
MRCPACDSEAEYLSVTYPRSCQCKKCKLVFLNLSPTFTDETL